MPCSQARGSQHDHGMQIDQLMTRALVTCHPGDRLDRAVQLMWDHDIGCVLVTGLDGRLVGIVTDRDACIAAWTQGLALDRIAVQDAMARSVWSCGPSQDVHALEQVMRVHQIRRVPVVDALGIPIGIVSLNDLARAARSSPDAAINQREVERTLAAISMPRHSA